MRKKFYVMLMLGLLFPSNLNAVGNLTNSQDIKSIEKKRELIKPEKIDKSSKIENVSNRPKIAKAILPVVPVAVAAYLSAILYKNFSHNNGQNPPDFGNPGQLTPPNQPYNPPPTPDITNTLTPNPGKKELIHKDSEDNLENLIPGVTGFLKDKKTIKDYIDTTIPEITKILEKQNAVADLKPSNGKDVMIIGDIHGDEKTLKWVVKNSYEHLQNGGSVVFLGDLIDHRFRGPDKSIETILWAFHLIKLFPDRVVVIRGNHDSVEGGWMGSLDSYKCDKLNSCMAALPMACEIQSNGRKFFCVHGYIPLLDDYSNFKSKIKKINLFDSATHESDGSIEYGMMWNDPIGPTSKKSGKQDGKSDTEQGCGSIWVGQDATERFFNSTGYKAIFRGHDPKEKDIDIKIDQNHIFTIHSLSWFTNTTNHTVQEGSQRNARIALVSEHDVEIKYFQDDEKGPDLTINI